MKNEDIRTAVAELRRHQRTIQAVTAARQDGWRSAVVAGRLNVAAALGRLSAIINDRSETQGLEGVRRAVSNLRTLLAEHQARWSAVAIDPNDAAYAASVARVRGAYAHLDLVVADLDRPARPNA